MNDELFQAEYRTRMTRSMSDEDLAREMYEAGIKIGREELATDQSRVIEGLTRQRKGFIAALATIQMALQDDHIQNNKHRMGILAEQDVDYAIRVTSEVLAEARRIMEGK